MLLLILLLLFWLGAAYALNTYIARKNAELDQKNPMYTPKEKKCPPHKWTYYKQEEGEYLKCAECGIFPGAD